MFIFQTRVLITHGIHWLPMVDNIIVMVNGRITEMGSYENLINHDGPLYIKHVKTKGKI
jgi:ABC-type multidrug transport system fused ATPase/permease subunit